jgi:UDP-3-O-[3-hydroxymyristoyl] N-acetylglucosamine deacetylase/3-hydroxyacyl-[acyl-carrier-protein] dehydratase
MLDMLGDLALSGQDIVGHVVAHRSGHQLNAALVRALLDPASAGETAEEICEDSAGLPLDVMAVMKILPHRYPFLMVDRVLRLEPGRSITAVKNVTVNEPFFMGHWPGRPIMPGVMILEALAQASGIMISDFVDRAKKVTMIAAIDEVRIRRPVVPGDQLRLEVTCLRLKSSSAHVLGVARVGNQLAAEAKFKFVMVDVDRSAA